MNNKMKIVLTGLLTIAMFIGVKFGPVNEIYKLDVNLENMYDQLDSYLYSVEVYAKSVDITNYDQVYELQEQINLGREMLNNIEIYIDVKNNPRIIKEEILPQWSERLDSLQQVILTQLIDEIINLKDYYKINTEEFINKIPDNIPDQWKEYLKNLLYK